MGHLPLISRIWMATVVAVALCAAGGRTAQAQFLSPGALTRAHEQLEGVTNCTSCHTVGGKGVDRAKCLSCHEPLRDRIEAGTGYHAGVSERCESCHHGHLGKDFDMVNLDETSFDHRETGYELLGSHLNIECRDCHKPDLITASDVRQSDAVVALDKTFLGLSVMCVDCHAAAEPHDGQFAQNACSDCHATTKWTETESFSHDQARFQLTGLHASVTCESCHSPQLIASGDSVVQYVSLEFRECSTCHADPHDRAFGTSCANCHSSEGWGAITSAGQRDFRHESTGYELLGAHSKLECSDCHRSPTRNDDKVAIVFKSPDTTGAFRAIDREYCRSCHVEFHNNEFNSAADAADAADKDCSDCHTTLSWGPTTYGIDRHNLESAFHLMDAHESTPCGSCHSSPDAAPRFKFANTTCEGCHSNVNPHNSSFADDDGATECDMCHDPSAWGDQFFDHSSTGFPLIGKHTAVSCKGCHQSESYKLLDTACASCHAGKNPHENQFEKDCASCHDATGFVTVSSRFDHADSRFRLDGAHKNVPCESCHAETADTAEDSGRTFIRYVPTSPSCKSCHADEQG